MSKNIRPWKIAVVASSVLLAGGVVAYAAWRAKPTAAQAPKETGQPPALTVEKPEEPAMLLPGTKAPIGIGSAPAIPPSLKEEPEAPAAEPEVPVHFGGSKSMPLLPPSGGE
jgi:hypothetical protein